MIHRKLYIVAWRFRLGEENYSFNDATFYKKVFAEQKMRLLRADREFIHPQDVIMRTIIIKFTGKR